MSLSEQSNPPLRLLAAFQHLFPGHIPAHIVQAPGREMWAAVSPGHDGVFTVHIHDLPGRTTFTRRSAKTQRTLLNRPLPHWARYPAGVILELSDSGFDLDGVEVVIASDETPGPRYNYSLGMTFAALIYTLYNRPYTADNILEIVEKVRRDYIE